MAFWDKISKLAKSAESAIDKMEEFGKNLQSEFTNVAERKSETFNQMKTTEFDMDYDKWDTRSTEEVVADFKEIIAANFAEYDVEYDVSAASLDATAHPACTPIQFLFKKAGKPVLALVIVRQNTYRGMNVIGTHNICEKLGITYVRFFEEYENKTDYVVERIKSYL